MVIHGQQPLLKLVSSTIVNSYLHNIVRTIIVLCQHYQYFQFNKCLLSFITILFRHCLAINVASWFCTCVVKGPTSRFSETYKSITDRVKTKVGSQLE